jgi:PAS domain S-box-containing protein
VASLIADEVERAIIVLDGDGAVRLLNTAAERVLGWEREALHGRPLATIVPGERHAGLAALLGDGLTGARQRAEVLVVTSTGARLTLSLRMRGVRIDEASALICDVEDVRRAPEVIEHAGPWLDVRLDDFGRIVGSDGPDGGDVVGRRCFEAVVGLTAPCPACPLARLDIGGVVSDVEILPDDRTLVRRLVRTSADTARVSHAVLEPGVVRELFEARLRGVPARSLRSEREREVLAELIEGRALDQIAAALRISERTVRFHQANVLAKLGVDSRLELVRIFIT